MRLNLENLTRRYSSQKTNANGGAAVLTAVNNVSLEIPDGGIYGIIGKSGAGKSTLVRLLSLLEKPDAGAILYDGERVDNLGEQQLMLRRRKIGMIFQNFCLFSSRNARSNIAYPLEIDKTSPFGANRASIEARCEELLALVGLEGRGNAPISTLSGGQKQRVAIARALANNPAVLFCDEATSALDPLTTRSILRLIRDLQARLKLTVVMITHQMEVVRDTCEQVAVLDNGNIVETGTVTDIFTRPCSPVTRDFLAHLTNETRADIVRWSHEGGKYTLRFVGEKTGEPVMSALAQKFPLSFNIRAGGVQHVADRDVGTLIADITAPGAVLRDALAWLTAQGIIVEEEEGS